MKDPLRTSLIYLLPVIFYLLPDFVFAQDFRSIVNRIVGVIQLMFPLVGGLMLLVFFWGVVRYVFINTEAATKSADKAIITWGLVGMFVAFSVWGLVRILASVFGVSIAG